MQLIQKLRDDKKYMKKVEPSSRSKAIEDIISIESFMEALVLNHYVLVRKILVIVQQVQGRQRKSYSGRVMLLVLEETMQVDRQRLLNATTIKTKDLDTYDSDCDDILNAKAVLMANISNYGSDVISEKAQRIKPTLYDGNVISDKHVAMPLIDDEETLILEEERQSKILSEDFGKRFVPQQELTAKQAFWFHMSNPTIKSSVASPVKMEVPKERPKVSLVNESLKKLKFHLAKFDNVVKIRTTPDACTKGKWGFEHTKAVFNNEIIPFLKSLKDIFNVFDKDLLNEIMEVQIVFNQIDDAVQRSLVDKQCLEIAKKELLLENDRLLQQIMSQDVLLTMMNSMPLNGESVNMKRKRNESCDKYFNLDAEVLKTQNAHNDLLKSYSQLEKHWMFKLDLDPLALKLLQYREAQIDYLKYTQEQADILLEIVEQAKVKQPLDNALDFACKHAKRIQELLVYVRDTCPNAIKLSTKKVVATPKNNVKTDMFDEPLTSSSNIKQVESSKISYSNTPVLSPTGLKCSTSNCRSKPTDNKKKDRISQTPSSNMKNKVDAQPRKVNKKSCRTFTIVSNSCPLTRITSANVVPPKKTTSYSVKTQKPKLKVYNGIPKTIKNVGSSKKAKIVEPKNANHSEPNNAWGSNATDISSSSSLVMTVRFGNDQIARIIGYGDYQLGNVTISRVNYVKGLGHNLFLIGQFCDTDLEIAFWKNICFICNLEGVDLLLGSRDTNFSGPGLYSLTPATSSSGLVPSTVSQQPCIPPNRDAWDRLFKPMFGEYFNPSSIAVSPVHEAAA
uniref:Integrase, catalytic region, zinc finger, CCHC-type, peptidase aspartic, catalytic n=1 Tax=Tanacetum cinerariifolium TaxID=118510 RepID=A0A6L2J9H7_TANCI|nr:integrase, catalytic region, zinc finger, CCHC-type, peptidase aspartic, catalytic [Tanacetum cinerariifolium]